MTKLISIHQFYMTKIILNDKNKTFYVTIFLHDKNKKFYMLTSQKVVDGPVFIYNMSYVYNLLRKLYLT